MKNKNVRRRLYEICIWVHFCGQVRCSAIVDITYDNEVDSIHLTDSNRKLDVWFDFKLKDGRPPTMHEIRDACAKNIYTEHRIQKLVEDTIRKQVIRDVETIDIPLSSTTVPLSLASSHYRMFKEDVARGRDDRFGRLCCILNQ